MEEVLSRFSLIAESIFETLDIKSLTNCRKIGRNWNSFIKEMKFFWILILKKHRKFNVNNSKCKKLFSETKIEDVREFAKSPFLNHGHAAFHHACLFGHTMIVKAFIQVVISKR